MNSEILNWLGIGWIDPVYIFAGLLLLILILFIMLLVQGSKRRKLEARIQKFMGGRAAESLENEITKLFEDNARLMEDGEKNRHEIENINRRMTKCFQKIGVVKYDAFNQMGGKLSYALAMLDEQDNGFVMNSVHSVDACYSYVKEVKHGVCELELGDEEQIALKDALNNGGKL